MNSEYQSTLSDWMSISVYVYMCLAHSLRREDTELTCWEEKRKDTQLTYWAKEATSQLTTEPKKPPAGLSIGAKKPQATDKPVKVILHVLVLVFLLHSTTNHLNEAAVTWQMFTTDGQECPCTELIVTMWLSLVFLLFKMLILPSFPFHSLPPLSFHPFFISPSLSPYIIYALYLSLVLCWWEWHGKSCTTVCMYMTLYSPLLPLPL